MIQKQKITITENSKYLSKLNEISEFPQISKYLSKLEAILEEITEPKRRLLKGALEAKGLGQKISAYLELDMFRILKLANLNPEFLEPRPDLKITLDNGEINFIEYTICNWVDQTNTFNRAQDIIGTAHQKAVRELSSGEFNSLKIENIEYNGREISKEEKNNIKRFFIDLLKNEPNKNLFIGKDISFGCTYDCLKKNLYFPLIKNKKHNSFLETLKEKKPKDSVNVPYFIAIYMWGRQGHVIFNQSKDNIISSIQIPFLNEIKNYFKKNPRISGLFLFPYNWFPISGGSYFDGEKTYNNTTFSKEEIIKGRKWNCPTPWSEKERKFLIIKNKNASIQSQLFTTDKFDKIKNAYFCEV